MSGNRGINNNYLRGGGILSIAIVQAGRTLGYRDLGDNNEVSLERTVENADIPESRSGKFEIAQRDITSSAWKITMSNRDVKVENLALAFGQELDERAVSATPVTLEVLYGAFNGALYYPGATLQQPDGILQLTSVNSVAISASARADSTAYAVGTVVTNSSIAYVYTVAGTSDSSPPSFPTAGGTVTDGTATLKHLGPVALVADDDYIVTLEPGQIQIAAGGAFATSMSRMPAGHTLDLVIGYTPVATTQWRMKELDGEREYFIRFNGASEKGEPIHWVARYCSVQGTGTLGFINSGDPMAINLEATPTSPDGLSPVQFIQKPKGFFID